MKRLMIVILVFISLACSNPQMEEEKKINERRILLQVLYRSDNPISATPTSESYGSTSSGSTSNYGSSSSSSGSSGTGSGSSSSSVYSDQWPLDYIAKLSSGDCKAIASGETYYCTTNDCKGIVYPPNIALLLTLPATESLSKTNSK